MDLTIGVYTYDTLKQTDIFYQPVDWRGLRLYDYIEIVKRPMDLGTIKKNLQSGEYRNIYQVAMDIRLVWKNCMIYNETGSQFFATAEKQSKIFEDKFSKIRIEGDDSGPVMKAPSLDEKKKLAGAMHELTKEQLGHLITMINEKCPHCIEQVDAADEIDVNLDLIDSKTFSEISKHIRSVLPSSKGLKKNRKSNESSEQIKKKAKT